MDEAQVAQLERVAIRQPHPGGPAALERWGSSEVMDRLTLMVHRARSRVIEDSEYPSDLRSSCRATAEMKCDL